MALWMIAASTQAVAPTDLHVTPLMEAPRIEGILNDPAWRYTTPVKHRGMNFQIGTVGTTLWIASQTSASASSDVTSAKPPKWTRVDDLSSLKKPHMEFLFAKSDKAEWIYYRFALLTDGRLSASGAPGAESSANGHWLDLKQSKAGTDVTWNPGVKVGGADEQWRIAVPLESIGAAGSSVLFDAEWKTNGGSIADPIYLRLIWGKSPELPAEKPLREPTVTKGKEEARGVKNPIENDQEAMGRIEQNPAAMLDLLALLDENLPLEEVVKRFRGRHQELSLTVSQLQPRASMMKSLGPMVKPGLQRRLLESNKAKQERNLK